MRWFTLAEIAQLFDVSVSTVKRWVDRDLLETSPVPGGSKRRATAASIRTFARHYGPASFKAFGGILAVGLFSSPAPDGVQVVPTIMAAGRALGETFPAVVLVSYADGRHPDLPRQLREAGFDGLVACVLNDDDTSDVADLQGQGWQMVCRAGGDYWGAAKRLEAGSSHWRGFNGSNATNEHKVRKKKTSPAKDLHPPACVT